MPAAADLDELIAQHHFELRTHDGLRPAAVLHALADLESGHGARHLATLHEPAYCYRGFYYRSPNGEDLRRLSRLYGCLSHSSFSSWQIMYIVAYEEGFRGDPCELRNDAVAIQPVIHYLNRRIFDKYPRIEVSAIADAWNSGRPYDENKPVQYIERFVASYEKWLKELDPTPC